MFPSPRDVTCLQVTTIPYKIWNRWCWHLQFNSPFLLPDSGYSQLTIPTLLCPFSTCNYIIYSNPFNFTFNLIHPYVYIYIYIYPCWSNNLTLQYGQIVNVEVGSPPISIQKAPGRQHDWGGSLFTWFSLVAVWRIPSQKKIVGKFPLPSGKKWTVPSTILSHTSNGFMLDKGACTFWDWIEAFMETCKTDVQVSIGALLLPPRSSWTYFGSICGRSCVYIYGSWILIT